MSVKEVSIKPFQDQKPGTYVIPPHWVPHILNVEKLRTSRDKLTIPQTDQVFVKGSLSSNNRTTPSHLSPPSFSPSHKVLKDLSWSLEEMDVSGIPKSFN